MGSVPENIRSWLTLALLPALDRRKFFSLIDAFGSPEDVLALDRSTLTSTGCLSQNAIDQVLNAHDGTEVDKELSLIEKHDVSVVTINDEEYPDNLRNSSNPPPLLYVKGSLIKEDNNAVSIVGARRSSPYGKTMCEEIARYLARAGLTIVSGMAIGIDAIAHKAAIDMGGRTIAVLGNGLSICYPSFNRTLFTQIEQHGALISEYPMEMKPAEWHFPERNWIVACMSLGTVVVEATDKSGGLITARCAMEENRSVYAVPGDVNKLRSKGTNALIQQGALLVMRGDDVFEDLQPQLEEMLKLTQNLTEEKTQKPNTTQTEQEVLTFIKQEPVYIDDLVNEFELKSITRSQLFRILLNLEMKGLVRQLPGKMFTSL